MNSLNLDPKKTALVMIDLQKGIVGMPTAPYSSAEVVEGSNCLAKKLREKGGTVVYVRVDMANVLPVPADTPMRPPNTPPATPEMSDLVPEAGYQDGDLLITKRHWGAFAGTKLEEELKKRGVDTVVITGISTNVGVESTVRQGTGLGFGFVVVEDACASRDAGDHRYSFEKTFPRLARVRTTDEVITALG